jgi:hypothetical protein
MPAGGAQLATGVAGALPGLEGTAQAARSRQAATQ